MERQRALEEIICIRVDLYRRKEIADKYKGRMLFLVVLTWILSLINIFFYSKVLIWIGLGVMSIFLRDAYRVLKEFYRPRTKRDFVDFYSRVDLDKEESIVFQQIMNEKKYLEGEWF